MWQARVLLAAVLVVCVASSADARRRHHGYYGYGERSSSRATLDEWRARQAQGQNSEQSRDETRGEARGDDRDQSRDQARGDERGQDSVQRRGQDRAYDRAQDRAQEHDRWQERRDYRARYDRRRARSFDDWRYARDRGDWQHFRDDWRRARDDDRRRYREREALTPVRAAERGDLVLPRGRSGPFSATIEKLVRGCAVQAAEFEHWPFDAIERTVGPDESQRKALEGLRDSAKQAAQRLTADCPQDAPAAPAARLEAMEQGIDAALTAFDTVEPKLQAFYGALNDEQKVRLYRNMAGPPAANTAATTGRSEAREERRARREYSPRRDRWRAYATEREAAPERPARQAAALGWSGACEQFAAVLRNWPVREIERDVRLSDAQRVAFYELVTSSLKAADTLASACPADAALTPVGRMETMRKRLAAVRAATAAIRPALMHFYEALDQGQKVRFAGI
jgi:LTXXQ motif family protein